MSRKYNPLLDGENQDEIDLGDNGGPETERLIDRVTISDMEFPELFGQGLDNDFMKFQCD